MLSLLACHRREINKERSSRGTGKGQDKVNKSKWFAYEALRFIKDKNQCKPTLSSSLPPKVNQETISQQVEDLECTATDDVEDEDNVVMEADDLEQSQSASTSSREQLVQPSAPKRKKNNTYWWYSGGPSCGYVGTISGSQ
ncbi:uncharacterized protein LOC123321836 [Coccinella septempunctata]|uniref:uncharacterized protein LOC123321836 n=1 Tax=Coccinella septempunctata TaxID=41139 RepID=UPI001D06433C|nr:uncharacterized protein LOC123321836 [Coccinella septempunctata]